MKKGDKGMPRSNCPVRMGKVRLRNTHWRERRIVDEVDARGNPAKWHYVSEPVITQKPVRSYRTKMGREAGRGLLRFIGSLPRPLMLLFCRERYIKHVTQI